MRRLWTHRVLDAPADVVWRLLIDPEHWPSWGPSVRRAVVDGPVIERGATGTVTTVGGVTLPFEITDYDEGTRWAWKVAGLPATDHTVEPVGPGRSRVGFGVPWPAGPYLAVCRLALARLEDAARGGGDIEPDPDPDIEPDPDH